MPKYIIYSLKHSDKKYSCFWRADNAGYTISPFDAGQYTQEEIDAQPDYYNNGESTVAIPLDYKTLQEIGLIPGNLDKKVIEYFKNKKQ